MKQICLASLAVAAVLSAGCNRHNDAPNPNATVGTSGKADTVSRGDRDFVQDVASLNAAEIDLSRLAVQQSASADVKKFAQMMVDEHTAAGDKLSGVATQNAI